MGEEDLNAVVGRLLKAAGRLGARHELVPIPVGGNNRLFVVTVGGEKFVLKCYFQDVAETRNRLTAEYGFLEVTHACGIRGVPRPIASDAAANAALYEHIEGRRLGASDVDTARVLEAASFFVELNSARVREAARQLPTASDSCFSVTEHLRSVDRRLDRLREIDGSSATDREAAAFVRELGAMWKRERNAVLAQCKDPDRAIPEHWRSVSPSDFGFHNALLRPTGDVCFVDFEYAGWDDPAKMIGDFFAHPGLPVPPSEFEVFAARACAPFTEPEALIARAHVLSGVARFRWCCIMLNEFRNEVAQRRRFAVPGVNLEARKRAQLSKARNLCLQPGS